MFKIGDTIATSVSASNAAFPDGRPRFGIVLQLLGSMAIIRILGSTNGPVLVLQNKLRFTRDDEVLDLLAATVLDAEVHKARYGGYTKPAMVE